MGTLEGRKQVLRNVDLQECLAAGTFAVVEWPIGNPNAHAGIVAANLNPSSSYTVTMNPTWRVRSSRWKW
jgi:hypothetical protein